jgi:hypothetical protein
MPRGPERRIDKRAPLEHPTTSVSLRVAAVYLEVDVKTLDKWLRERQLDYLVLGRRRKIEVIELVAFRRRCHMDRKAG